MKTLKKLTEFQNKINEFSELFEGITSEINNEYKKNIKIERNILLKKISDDYNLDYEKLLEQYVYKNNTNHVILSIKKVKGKECFYQKVENTDVYDEDSNIIGKFVNNKITLNV